MDLTIIESTMLGPLWARADFSLLYPELLKDDQAIELKKKVRSLFPDSDKDFATLEEFVDEFLGLSLAIRARTFDDTIREFIETRPNASIINLGCGLDTTFSRIDNGTIRWYDLDLPSAIEFRLKIIPETKRSRCIAKSILDHTWMNDVVFSPEDGLLLFAGGLFVYFDETTVSSLFQAMAEKFTGGEIIFDSSSTRGNWFVNRRMKKLGIEGIEHKFEAGSRKQIQSWSSQIQIIDWFSYFARVKKSPRWSRRTRLLMSLNTLLDLAKFIHVRFLES